MAAASVPASGRPLAAARRASTPGRAASSRISRAGRRHFSAGSRSGVSINPFPTITAEVSVGDLDAFGAGAKIDESALRDHGLVKGRYDRIKVLGNREITKAVTVSAHAFSKSAAATIEKAGGKVVLLTAGHSERNASA